MLKWLAILTVLLILAPIVPGQGENKTGPNPQPAKEQPPALHAPNGENSHGQPGNNETQTNSTPPARNTSLERPQIWWRDSNWWLVIIAACTGCVIGWQSLETRRAAEGAFLAAQASMAQIEHSKAVQRAQIRIEFVDPSFSFNGEGYPVLFRVIVDGTTRAYVLDESILAYVGESKRTETMRRGLEIPRHIAPEESSFEGHTLIHVSERVATPETDMNELYLARNGNLTLFVEGHIRYRDIFGDEWLLSIDRYWDFPTGMWGTGKGDYHRQIKDQPSKTTT
jgi:hypothetical protein